MALSFWQEGYGANFFTLIFLKYSAPLIAGIRKLGAISFTRRLSTKREDFNVVEWFDGLPVKLTKRILQPNRGRYLYRGVISDKHILRDDGETVTSFQYQDSQTKKMKTRQLRGEEFMALVLQHTLPKGFRRARDYGFLHGNAKRLLQRVQWALQVIAPPFTPEPKPHFICSQCQCAMSIVGFMRPRPAPQ